MTTISGLRKGPNAEPRGLGSPGLVTVRGDRTGGGYVRAAAAAAASLASAALVTPSSDFTNAAYTASDHQPRHRAISASAAWRDSAGRYGRAVVSASYTSTMPTICAASGISSPRRRSG